MLIFAALQPKAHFCKPNLFSQPVKTLLHDYKLILARIFQLMKIITFIYDQIVVILRNRDSVCLVFVPQIGC